MPQLILGIAGKAGAGKDTLYKLLLETLDIKYSILRHSLGDIIRDHLNELPFIQHAMIDFHNLYGPAKEIWRPLMVEYGLACRKETRGRFFIERLERDLKYTFSARNVISCITDIRFNEYEKDEIHWLKNEMGGKLIYLDRYTEDLSGLRQSIPFVNDTERKQDASLRENADITINWPTTTNKEILLEHVKPLIDNIQQNWLPLQSNKN